MLVADPQLFPRRTAHHCSDRYRSCPAIRVSSQILSARQTPAGAPERKRVVPGCWTGPGLVVVEVCIEHIGDPFEQRQRESADHVGQESESLLRHVIRLCAKPAPNSAASTYFVSHNEDR